MSIRVFVSVAALLGITCAAHAQIRSPLPKLHPSFDEFMSHVHYPYYAAPERQRRIERAARTVRVGWTEQQVLALLGPPDYKGGWIHHVPSGDTVKTAVDESWEYIYSLEQPPRYDRPGRLLSISLSNGSMPRRVMQVDGVDIPGLKRQNVPKT